MNKELYEYNKNLAGFSLKKGQVQTVMFMKEEVIKELKETVEILETKIKKMEQLNKLKDAKIDSLMRKLDENIGI